MSCVYKLTFPDDSVYIGKTDRKPEARWLNGWGYKQIPVVFNAILKYGWDNVKQEIIADNLTHEEAIQIELKEISKHSSTLDTIYNDVGISAQTIAQESAHYITPKESCTKHSTKKRKLPGTIKGQYKKHIIPLVPKPTNDHVCPIDVYTSDGKFIATYSQSKIAAEKTGVSHADVVFCCMGKTPDGRTRYQAKGYIFRYHDVLKDLQF